MSLSAVSTARGAALGVGWVPDLRTNTLNAPRACARAAIRMPALALELTRRPHAPSRSPLRPRRARSAATPAAAHRRPWRSRGRQWRLQRHCLVVCGSTGVRVLICRPGGWVVCASACFCARRTSTPYTGSSHVCAGRAPPPHSLHWLPRRCCGQTLTLRGCMTGSQCACREGQTRILYGAKATTNRSAVGCIVLSLAMSLHRHVFDHHAQFLLTMLNVCMCTRRVDTAEKRRWRNHVAFALRFRCCSRAKATF